MEPGAGQAARPWRPILPFEVEEDSGMGLRRGHGRFHRHSPHIPRHWPLVGHSDSWRDHLEGEWGCSTKQEVGGKQDPERWDTRLPGPVWQERTFTGLSFPSGKRGAQLGLGETSEPGTSRPRL